MIQVVDSLGQLKVTGAGGGGGGNTGSISGGTTRGTLGEVVFSNSNGVSFGMNGQTMTASHNGLTSQSNQAFSAQGGSSAFQTLSFNNANGITFSNNAGAVEASYTVPSTAGLLSNIRVSAGTTSNLLSALTFNNGNGISFGLDASTITASYTVPTVTNSSWTVSDAVTSQTIGRLAFTNANGITMTLSTSNNGQATVFASHNGLTSQSNQNVTAGNGGFAFQTLSFSNVNGISFGTSAGSAITASHNGITSQTNQDITLYATGNTTQNSSTVINANSLLFGGRGNVSVGFSNGSIQISDTGAAGGGITNINISAGTTSNNLSAFTLANSNNITFGLDGSTVTASFNAINVGVSTAGNTAGTTGTVEGAGGQYLFVGSNGITLSQSTNGANSGTVTINGDARTLSGLYWGPMAGLGGPGYFAQSSFSLGQNSLYLYPIQIEDYLTVDHVRVPVMVTNSSSAAASIQKGYTYQFGIYTRNATNATVLTRHYSTSYTLAASHNSNASWMLSLITAIGDSTSYNTLTASSAGLNLSASLHGAREFIMPISSLMSPGEYWLGLVASTSTAGGAGSVLQLSNLGIAVQTFNRPGLSTNATNSGWYKFMGHGTYSATTAAMPAGISATQINQLGSMPIMWAATGTV